LLNGHFEEHGSDFGATTAEQASDFLTDQDNPNILEFNRVRCTRTGDTVRFNPEN